MGFDHFNELLDFGEGGLGLAFGEILGWTLMWAFFATFTNYFLGMFVAIMINKKGMKNSEVYTAANLTKQYFSKIMNGKVAPSKNKILSLAVALHLNMDETIDFLRMSGYAFTPFSKVDRVFEYFIRKEEYNIFKIDIVLFDAGLPTLSND